MCGKMNISVSHLSKCKFNTIVINGHLKRKMDDALVVTFEIKSNECTR